MGSQRGAITAFVRYYPEIPLISCATIAAILGSIKMLNGDNAEILLSYAGFLCIFYVIIASIKLLKHYEKNLNSGFNMPIVLTYFFGLASPTFWRAKCGDCGVFGVTVLEVILYFSLHFFIPLILLLLNIPWDGDQARKRFFFGILLSIPFCLFSSLLSGFITNNWGYWL